MTWDMYKRMYNEKREQIERLERRIAGLKGAITRMKKNKVTMADESVYYNWSDDQFGDISSLEDYILQENDADDVSDLPDHFQFEAWECELQKVGHLETGDLEDFADTLIPEGSEDREEVDDLYDVLKKYITQEIIDKINDEFPKLWYPKTRVIITKQFLLDQLKTKK